ncbi:hypothetical protein LOC59_13055 [Arthrobacter sp. zg-Y916]|uniref:Glycine zipper n=1 Tax=Arthrobacter caoxuetaonis TaxID=2886935 RepID=A0A9X1SDF3_9MICC|nr:MULTISPECIES: hypothetical protein [Arthrobacter]MCC3299560.1 hypothetical protein [Arthrobacter caoxuetaonis]MCC9194568.1 hypothetical protein [Arthrobacter sp. zg-Y916]USQ57806.1 hypothetical protein NF551_02820 [Arthrobacter caoxuetaonis]
MSAGNLPVLPDTCAIREDAAAIDASGKRAKDYGQDLVATWTALQDSYQAPEQDIVHGAMDKAAIYTDATADVTGAIRNALDAYADAVDALRPRYDALVAALEAHACRPLDDDSQESAAAAQSEEARLTRESASIAAELQAAEDACAAAISGLHTSFLEPHRIATSPYAAVSSGLAANGLLSVHQNPGPRLIRIALDPGSNRRRLNVPGSVTLRLNGRPYRYLPAGSLMAAMLAPLGARALTIHRPVFRDPQVPGARRRTNASGNSVAAPELPRWANRVANGLGVADGALSVYKNWSEQWNQDQLEHPEMSTGDRVGSAAATAVVEGGGAIGGSIAGTAIGASLGSLIPIPVVGTLAGAAVGGWVGGAVGEGIGNVVRNLRDKGLADAVGGGLKETWENLKLW